MRRELDNACVRRPLALAVALVALWCGVPGTCGNVAAQEVPAQSGTAAAPLDKLTDGAAASSSATGKAAQNTAQRSSTGLQAADYAIVLLYLVVVLAMGIWLSRRQKSSEEYFVAGRNMPWIAVGLSMVASLLSTLTYLGTPGEMIKNGAAIMTGMLAMPFSFIVVGFLWIPFYMRLNVTSAYEYLERRFGHAARLLGVALFLWLRFIWMGVIIFTASQAVAHMTVETGPDAVKALSGGRLTLSSDGWLYLIILSAGLLATGYTTLGGIRAVIWTDVLQFVILFGGAVLTILFIGSETGTGLQDWWHNIVAGGAKGHDAPLFGSWNLSTGRTVLWVVLSAFFWNVCTHGSDQVALQRYFTTRSPSAARWSLVVNVIADVSMTLLLAACGMALLSYYLTFPDRLPVGVKDVRDAAFADNAFPDFIAHGLPVGISGLVVAAIFAVAMSSIDSGINSVCTVLTVDLFRRRGVARDQAGELRLAKWLTLGIGVVVTAMGLAATLLPDDENIIDMTLRTFNCELGPLAAMFFAGMLLPHVSQRTVLGATLIGAVVGPAIAFWRYWVPCIAYLAIGCGIGGGDYGIWDPMIHSEGPSPFLVVPISCVVTFLLAAGLGGILRGPRPEQLDGLTWRSVVLGESPK